MSARNNMRPSNSVGGHRIYPSHPLDAESNARIDQNMAVFNDGMDRLNRARALAEGEDARVNGLNNNDQRVIRYRELMLTSAELWQLALQKQHYLQHGGNAGPYSVNQLGERMIQCALSWQQWRQEFDAQE